MRTAALAFVAPNAAPATAVCLWAEIPPRGDDRDGRAGPTASRPARPRALARRASDRGRGVVREGDLHEAEHHTGLGLPARAHGLRALDPRHAHAPRPV